MNSLRIARRVAPLLLMLCVSARADDSSAAIHALVDKAAPSIVTVKLVLTTQVTVGGQSQNHESRTTLLGTVVDPDGLIMVHLAWVPAGGKVNVQDDNGAEQEVPFTMTPSGLKVVFGREDKDCDAFLVATDADLGLAFLKVGDLGGRKPAPVDFAAAADPDLGQTLYVIGRQKMAFDYAPYLSTLMVAAKVAKPREAWLTDRTESGYGLPVFSEAGKLAGFLAKDMRADKEDGESAGEGDLSIAVTGGSAPEVDYILPAARVRELVDKARKKAAEMASEPPVKKDEPAPKGSGDKK